MPTVPPGSLPLPALPGLADVSPLGHGGFADVHLGRQIHLERWVAAKVFRVTLADPAAADRFRAECRTLGRLDQYPHVITVHDAGVLPDGRPYLISERCDGSLADLVDVRGPLPVDRVVEIGSTTARALLFAHSCGVLHGDVTPRNVLLRASGAPVLADFGMAVLREHRGAPAAGYSADHAAPETVLHGVVDEAGDVFGLGSTLWSVLSGHPPFPAAASGEAVRLARIEAGPPTPPATVPSWLATVLARMLAADPRRRPSVDEVVTTLAAGGPVAVPGPAPCSVAAMAAVDDPTPPAGLRGPAGDSTRLRGMAPVPRPRAASEPTTPARASLRATAPWLVVAAAALLGGGGGAWWYVADSAATPAPTPVPSVSAAEPTTSPPSAAPTSSPAGAVRPSAVVDAPSGPVYRPRQVPRRSPEPVVPAPEAPVVVAPPVATRPVDNGDDGQNGGDGGSGFPDFGDGNDGQDGGAGSGFPFN